MWQILNARVRYVIVKTMSRIIKIPQIKFEQVILIEPLKLKNTHANTIIYKINRFSWYWTVVMEMNIAYFERTGKDLM